MTATIAIMLSGKLKNHFELILEDILPSPIITRDAKQRSVIHPAKELKGVKNGDKVSAGNLYPVKNDNPKKNDPIKSAPPPANARSFPFDLLSMSGNEFRC
jgi:hypothetical protein